MRRLQSACSRLSAPRSSSSLSRRLLQPGVAHHPRSSAPFGAAAQGEPELRAAFSRAARQHLAVLALSGAFAARASTIVQCETQPRLAYIGHQLRQQYCPITTKIANLSCVRTAALTAPSRISVPRAGV